MENMNLTEMIETVVDFSSDGLSWLQLIRAVVRQFGVKVTVKQAKQAARLSKRHAIEIEGKIRFEL
jgi:hypothetical protein